MWRNRIILLMNILNENSHKKRFGASPVSRCDVSEPRDGWPMFAILEFHQPHRLSVAPFIFILIQK